MTLTKGEEVVLLDNSSKIRWRVSLLKVFGTKIMYSR